MSIPENYTYNVEKNRSTEIYNKLQIERYVSWKDKLKKIIPEIYKIEDLSTLPFWGDLHELVTIRDNIVHQKSAEDTNIIEKLLKMNILKICFSSIELISHVYDEAFKNNSLPECCERFPIVSKENDIRLVKKISTLEPILKPCRPE